MKLNFAPKNTFEEKEIEVLRDLSERMTNACSEVSSCEFCPLLSFKNILGDDAYCTAAYDILLECLGV